MRTVYLTTAPQLQHRCHANCVFLRCRPSYSLSLVPYIVLVIGETAECCRERKDVSNDDEGKSSTVDVDDNGVEVNAAEEKRRAMREALGRRMKRELIESEQERLSKVCIRKRKYVSAVWTG